MDLKVQVFFFLLNPLPPGEGIKDFSFSRELWVVRDEIG
jgi:hypothetical protein